MIVVPLSQTLIPQVEELMRLGTPFVCPRTHSDYWLYARLFSSTCPVAMIDDDVAGAVIAFRSQDTPDEVYVQDVATHPGHRGKGVARTLLSAVSEYAIQHGCARIYLTSEPDNSVAHCTWLSLGFLNLPGDRVEDGVEVIADFKGPGRDRAVYELDLGRERLGTQPVVDSASSCA
ncbi:MAG: GNAT family N-acetyltransferase [Pseudonocardia sp.]